MPALLSKASAPARLLLGRPGLTVARRGLGDTVTGPPVTDLKANFKRACEFFTKDPLSYGEFKQQCASLRMFVFTGVTVGCALSLIVYPPKSSYWRRWNPTFWPTHLKSLFSSQSPPMFLTEKAKRTKRAEAVIASITGVEVASASSPAAAKAAETPAPAPPPEAAPVAAPASEVKAPEVTEEAAKEAVTEPEVKKGPALDPVFSLELHRTNRETLLKRFKEAAPEATGAVLFFAGGTEETIAQRESDAEGIFRQESTFHYLFGVLEPDYLGAINADTGATTLFCPRLDEAFSVWMGKIKSPEDIKEMYGVDEVVYADQAQEWFEKSAPASVYVDLGPHSDSGHMSKPADFKGMRDAFKVDQDTLHNLVYESRVHKSPEEVRLMRKVNQISADAHIAMMRSAQPGMMEYQLESLIMHHTYFNGGCRLQAYTGIVGSGPHGAVLHYGHAGEPNSRRMQDGDMVLCDMGAELHCYASDITNSFPVNGKFTADQRLIYETVQEMQAAVLQNMGPGVSWPDMQTLANEVLCNRLRTAGLLQGELTAMAEASVAGVLMPHGLGHFLGIDTHDVGGYPPGSTRDERPGFKSLRTRRVLEPGMVITVEPGVYFNPWSLAKAKEDPKLAPFFCWDRIADFMSFGGVRLEDNVLITDTGIDNLTVAPRSVEEVEAVMRGEVADSAALLERRKAKAS